MIVLDSNLKSMEIVSTIAELQWTISYLSVTKTICGTLPCSDCKTNSEAQGLTVIGTATILPAPSLSTVLNLYSKEVEYINVYNSNASTAQITIQINNNSTDRILIKVYLNFGDNLFYENGKGWYILNQFGATPTPIIFDDMTFYQTAGTNTYTATIPSLISYTQILNKAVGLIIANNNTTSSTINFNGLGALTMLKFGTDTLEGTGTGALQEDIKSGQRILGTYDGTNFQIISITDNIAQTT